jgi:hypothetical protein
VTAKSRPRKKTREGCSSREGVPGREKSSAFTGRRWKRSRRSPRGRPPTRACTSALLAEAGHSNGGRDRGARRSVTELEEQRRKCLPRNANVIHSGEPGCRETPGSPGTAWVVQAARGRSREANETRVLVVVLDSRNRWVASPVVSQGEPQGDLGTTRPSSEPSLLRRLTRQGETRAG